MPAGQKVGDAYIEVRPFLNDQRFRQQTQRAIDRSEAAWTQSAKRMSERMTTLYTKAGNQAVAANQESLNRIDRQMGAHHARQLNANQRVLDKRHRQHTDTMVKILKAERHVQKETERLRVKGAAGPTGGDSKTPKGPRPGSMARAAAESFTGGFARNLLSIMPGQLEKIFLDPRMASVGIIGGVFIGSVLTSAMAGAIGAGMATAGLVGATMFLMKADPAFAKVGAELGQSLKVSMLNALAPLRGSLESLMRSGAAALERIIAGIDMGPLANVAAQFEGFFASASPIITAIINNFNELGAAVMPNVLAGFKKILEQVQIFSRVAKENGSSIGEIVENMLKFVAFGVSFLSALIKVAGALKQLRDVTLGVARLAFPGLAAAIDTVTSAVGRFMASTSGFGQKIAALAAAARGDWTGLAAIIADTQPQQTATAAYDQMGTAAAGAVKALEQGSVAAAVAQAAVSTAITASGDALQRLIDLTDAYNNKQLAAMDADIAWADAQDTLKNSLKASHGQITLKDQKTRASRRAVLDGIRLANDAAKAALGENNNTKAANAAYRAKIENLIKTSGASKATAAQIRALAGKLKEYNAVPTPTKKPKVNTGPALSAIGALEARLSAMQKRRVVEVVVTTSHRSMGGGTIPVEERAEGGFVRGPGTATSDSIPARLSDGEFVLRASAVKNIGVKQLEAINQGKVLQRAKGGTVGKVSATAANAKMGREFLVFSNKLAVLTTQITKQVAVQERYLEQLRSIQGSFDQFTNLSAIETEGKTAGDILKELMGRRKQEEEFTRAVTDLKKRGLWAEGVQQLLDAGPGSPLAKMLTKASAYDIGIINRTLADTGPAKALANAIMPNAASNQKSLVANQKQAAAIKAKQAALAKQGAAKFAPKVTGARTVLFSKQELADLGLKSGQSIKVIIDGKEVRAIVRQENAKTAQKASTAIRRGR